jgi:hypothetical protein
MLLSEMTRFDLFALVIVAAAFGQFVYDGWVFIAEGLVSRFTHRFTKR